MVDSISKINFNNNIKLSGIRTHRNDVDILLFEASNAEAVASPAKKLSKAWSDILTKADSKKRKIIVSPEFFDELIRFAKEIKANPVDFTFIMFKESRFDPKTKCRDYLGLIQMDSTAFTECALGMMEYEKYCKDHPKEKITLHDYKKISNQKGFKKPNIGSDRITYSTYKNLPREKQLKYAEAYLKYRIHEKGMNGKQLSAEQLWRLIHRPNVKGKELDKELKDRRNKLNDIKKEIKKLYPEEYKQIISAASFKAKV